VCSQPANDLYSQVTIRTCGELRFSIRETGPGSDRRLLAKLALPTGGFTLAAMQGATPVAGEVAELAQFLKALAEEGQAPVWPKPLPDDSATALDALQQVELIAREDLALESPTFSPEAALWAARLFYQLCQFTVCRDLGAELVAAACEQACPAARSPATDWSADLTFRHLPRLYQLARHLSEADPLVEYLKRIASEWPLSSVGIPGLDDLSLESFLEHPALRRLYADRIVAAEDASRLRDPRVEDLLRADLGIHRQLAPALAARLYPAPA
jgi:MoxR-vWA-beta-propeller ternary system domain bpX4